MSEIVLIAHNLRSCHNVGSLLRTAEGLGVRKVYLTGYTPYPLKPGDNTRLPHTAIKLDKQIHKTALDAENLIDWEQSAALEPILTALKDDGYVLAAIEQAPNAVALPKYKAPRRVALLVGREVEGVEREVLERMDVILEIPMFGKKESFNVVQAAAMGLYHCTFKA